MTKREIDKFMTSREQPNVLAGLSRSPVGIELPRATTKHKRLVLRVMNLSSIGIASISLRNIEQRERCRKGRLTI